MTNYQFEPFYAVHIQPIDTDPAIAKRHFPLTYAGFDEAFEFATKNFKAGAWHVLIFRFEKPTWYILVCDMSWHKGIDGSVLGNAG
jgi:hypothetical protein